MDGNCLSLSITPPSRFRYLPRNKNLRSRGARATRPPHGAGASLQSLWDVGTLVLTRPASGLLPSVQVPHLQRGCGGRAPRRSEAERRRVCGERRPGAGQQRAAGRSHGPRGGPVPFPAPSDPFCLGAAQTHAASAPQPAERHDAAFLRAAATPGPPRGFLFFLLKVH